MDISVIVPVYNGAAYLRSCLEALKNSDVGAMEIIVVDDHSSDDSAAIASEMGATVVCHNAQQGPASARNTGAQQAKSPILFFVDADVVVQKNSLSKVLEVFEKHQDTAAVFGSYDDQPAAANFLSQYKNLQHHFVHQNSSEQAVTFWAGCGAIRKEIFDSLGGFDPHRYENPSIEDIELGLRLRKTGHQIRLEKSLQVKHLKRWSFASLLRADILYRAVPWSRLILNHGEIPKDLNLQTSHRISALLIATMLLLAFLAPFISISLLSGAAICLVLVLILNRKIYAFFYQHGGLLFMIGSICWHFLYYLYSGFTFVYCWVEHYLKPKSRHQPALVSIDEKIK